MYGVFLDVSFRKQAEESRELITREMHHRIKNIFALTSAIAGIASRTTTTKEALSIDLSQRLMALANAHDMIRPNAKSQTRAGELSELLTVLLKPYFAAEVGEHRVSIFAPSCLVGERSTSALAMIIHELATNSIKYGALSSNNGNVSIAGSDRGDDIVVKWTETGGPKVADEAKLAGFGSKLVMACVKDQLGGTISVDWPIDGIVVCLQFNRARLGE
jgi:two-component sensor histidine kinase